jgi:hypothetical protein
MHTDDHDTQPYEIEVSGLAEDFYGKNARLKQTGIPTYRSNPELQPKTFDEAINDVRREFNRWAQWGGH